MLMYKLLILTRNTWNYVQRNDYYWIGIVTWNHLTVYKLFVLRIVIWSSNCLQVIIIISYFKPYNNCLKEKSSLLNNPAKIDIS